MFYSLTKKKKMVQFQNVKTKEKGDIGTILSFEKRYEGIYK